MAKRALDAAYKVVWKNGKPNGQGVLTWPGGRRYGGTFKNGKMDGQGVLTWPDGLRYEGTFKNGKMDGQGVLTAPDGRRYEGTFKNGVAEGQGVLTWPDGRRHEGTFKNGKLDGQGVETWPDGRRYEGTFKNDKMDGQGVETWPDGRRHEGTYKNGMPEGHGVETWPDGRRYEGTFNNGVADGHGIQTLSDGKRYEGMWKNGKKHGLFMKRTPEGSVHVFYTNGSTELEATQADRIATTIQARARGFLTRNITKEMREEQRSTIAAEDALQHHLRELERTERRNGIVRSKKHAPTTIARVPQTAGRTRQRGGRTRNKRQPRELKILEPEDTMPWSTEVRQGHLKKQMDLGRHARATAANADATPVAPSYLDVLDLHENTKVEATEKLRAKIGGLKPRKNCNHLMVITGKGEHGKYACIKGHVRQLLDGAWRATYVVKRAGDGKGTDGFYVKITEKLQQDIKNAKESQLSPTRPVVVVSPRA